MNLKKLFKLLDQKKIIITIILTIISTLIGIIIPYIIGYIVDNLNKNIYTLLIILLLFYLVQFIITIINNRIIISMTENTIYKLRKKVFNKIQSLPLSYFDNNDTGDIMSTITNDIDSVNECLSEVITTITGSIITFIGVTIIMFYMNVLLSIIIILTVPLFFVIVSKMSKKIEEYYTKKQNLLASITSNTEEIVSNIKTIKEINKEEYFIEKFNKENDNFKKISIKSNLYSYLLLPINLIINNLSNILVIGLGSLLVLRNQITIGNIVAFLSYASMFKEPINDISSMIGTIGEASASLGRIYNILDYKINNKKGLILDIKGNIEFKNVYFKYNEKDVLKNISFKINDKTSLSIVGETGSGKTTIINLIEKFYNIEKGIIYIDGYDIKDIDKECLRKNIGLVLQETKFFKGTIIDNIKYGLDIEDEKIIKLCEKTKANLFIEKLPNGYYTMIDNESNILSNGEKQLISIIRCILKNPKIIILDEATSEVDIKTEKIIYESMKYLLKNKTCIMITHRLSTTKDTDKILLLEGGKVKEFGNHVELMKDKKDYFTMYNKQIN